MPLPKGFRLGPYEIVALLGAGGMGEVYRAWDGRLRRDVALKVLPDEVAADADRLDRFERESRAAAALNHPHVLAIHDVGRHEGRSYLVTELLEGQTLRELLAGAAPLPLDRVAELGLQLCRGLQAAHGKGIVHRDLKPENLFITADGTLKILDFGLARRSVAAPPDAETHAGATARTLPGRILGTIGYMAPEQVRGEPADARADIFAAGCTLYEMATGARAFQGSTDADTLSAVLRDEPAALRAEPARATLPSSLVAILRRCLAKDPAARYESAAALGADLERARVAHGEPPAARAAAARPPAVRRRLALGVGAAAVALLVVLLALSSPFRDSAASPEVRSIAVLPLQNRAGDAEQDFLTEGLTDALITRLAQVNGLRVISRSSVMRYRSDRPPLSEIAERLRVDGIVEGTVQRVGDRVRVTAHLVHVPTDTTLWSKEYDDDLRDVLALQAQIAQAIARELTAELGADEARRLSAARQVDPRVYQAVLRGRYLWNRRTDESIAAAREQFLEAVRLDPTYAPAYSGLADVYLTMFDYGLMRGDQSTAEARKAAEKAIELDHEQASAHASLGHIHLHEWRWQDADRAFRRAIEFDPSYTVAHHWSALSLTTQGRTAEAVAAMERAYELDPLSVRISADLGMAYLAARRYQEAVDQEKRTLELEPKALGPRWIMAMALQQLGQFDRAIGEMQVYLKAAPDNPSGLGTLGNLYAAAGRTADARAIIGTLEALAAKEDVAFFVALVHAGLDEKEAALDWLERAVKVRSGSVRYLKVEPRLDGLRQEKRYLALMRTVGLSP